MVNLLLVAASISCLLGMAWLALAMDIHWKQVRTDVQSASSVRMLRWLGGVSLFGSLLLCLATDHASMSSLVWIMLLAASALIIAFTFSWQPRLFSLLIRWIKPRR